MQNNSFSTNKIVILLVFVCAAIMASVFVFHLRTKQAPLVLTEDEGIIFPVARDIKPFALVAADGTTFTQERFRGHITLLFFGFTHCASICPTTLDMLQRVYTTLHPTNPTLQVVLISLDPERDLPQTLMNYTHSFHKDFIGASGKLQELRKLQSQLGIYSVRDSSNANYQLQHSASILLIGPDGKWAGMFRYGMQPEKFIAAFNKSMQQLNNRA